MGVQINIGGKIKIAIFLSFCKNIFFTGLLPSSGLPIPSSSPPFTTANPQPLFPVLWCENKLIILIKIVKIVPHKYQNGELEKEFKK